MSEINTVEDLIVELTKFPMDTPIRYAGRPSVLLTLRLSTDPHRVEVHAHRETHIHIPKEHI